MAGTTGLEPAASAVTGQRSNQLNYVPSLFSYLYRKPACLVAFLRFNRCACVARFNLVEPNSEVNGHQAKPSKTVLRAKHQPRAAVPAPPMNCSRPNSDQYRFCTDRSRRPSGGWPAAGDLDRGPHSGSPDISTESRYKESKSRLSRSC